jgi:UDP-glucose:glycoprotein glucosyltransferase
MVVLILLQCNNPLTKEPKLDRARRQIKEWEDLDNEATEFAKQVNAQLKAARPQQQQQQPKEDVPKPSEAGKQEQDIPKKDEL